MILSETAYHLMRDALEEIANAGAYRSDDEIKNIAFRALKAAAEEERLLIAAENGEDYGEDEDLDEPLGAAGYCNLDDEECESCQ